MSILKENVLNYDSDILNTNKRSALIIIIENVFINN